MEDCSISLFGERKAVLYRIPDTSIAVSAHSLTSETCDSGNSNAERQMLFAEHIWPGALVISDYLAENPALCKDKSVLELGAGAGLPSIVACKLGARLVVCSDFPDEAILRNLQAVADKNNCTNFSVEPHCWGQTPSNLLQHLREDDDDESKGSEEKALFDVLILAECLWKDTFPLHDDLLRSVQNCMHAGSTVLVSFAHRPCEGHTPEHDLQFLKKAEENHNLSHQLIRTVDKYSDAMDGDAITTFLYRLERKH